MNQRLLIAALLASSVYAEETVVLEKIQIAEDYTAIDERRDNSIAKRIIKAEELTQYGDANALEILRRTPGVTIPNGKGPASAPGKGYTVVMIDGEATSTGTSKRVSPLEQISPDMIERIEVMSNGSAEYTAESMGGIVNVVLKKPKAEGRTSAKVTLGAYGEDLSETAYVQREGKLDKVSYMVNLTASENRKEDRTDIATDKAALETDEERDDRSKNRSVGLRAKLNYTASPRLKILYDGSVTFNHNTDRIDSTTLTEGSATPTSRYQSHDDATNTMLWSALGAEHRFGDDIFEWKAKIHSFEERGDLESLSTPSATNRKEHDYVLSRFYGFQGDYTALRDEHFMKAGFELKRSDQIDETTRILNGVDVTSVNDKIQMKEDKLSLYIQDEYTLNEGIVITPGLRYETLNRDYGATSNLGYFAPSLHALFQVTPTDNIRASVAKTVRLPRLSQLSASTNSTLDENSIHRPDVIGNPNLTEEKALSYELRYEHFFEDKGLASIGGFYRTIDDKIENAIRFNSVSGRYEQTPENAGEGSLWGLELEFKKSLKEYISGLGLFANATLQDSSLTNTLTGVKRELLQTPNFTCNLGFDHTLKASEITYGAAYRYVGGYDDPQEYFISQSQKGYGTLDLYANKRLNKTFKVQLNVKNITASTVETTSRLYDAGGAITQTQVDKEHTKPQLFLSIEGKW
ncbi:TonB-dependent receptor [Sulfuricurvum kujiense DSM 16994]|uniref:TonB-dependent receptor n=1 Tax=Sulfuricurvum kujiense (strain ATCC BAA-921 / DSM 16994 / JCM 11577 / YK-1) TaxID=709032 RepID=E4TYW2_SULKY|nr:TonB-dependent receptor [Sulfuricurvum kujiense]ADR35122.1 TonB-dependent receptor [Sulfuricurvum kujiense DSM 16994]